MSLPHRISQSLLLTALLLVPRLAAQDVTVGDPVWLMDSPAPGSISELKKGLSPSYPTEMRDTDRIGYAAAVSFVSADGHALQLDIQATDPAFKKAVEINGRSLENLFQWNSRENGNSWRPSIAVVDGRPVDTFVWVPVIFNPASASVNGPNATPRLLSVVPVYVNTKFLHADGSPTPAHVRVALDASGGVVTVTPTAPDTEHFYWPTIEKAVAGWRFAPARKDGRTVAAEVEIAVLPQPFFRLTDNTDKVPVLLKSVLPIYPESMENLRLRAQVTVNFALDTRGRVDNPVVIRSTNPAFNENAILAIRQWKFTPAIHHGRPVRFIMSQQLIFEMEGQDYTNGVSAYSTGQESSDSGPRENGPPVVQNVVDPVYPYDLLRAGVAGSASERMIVDKQGRVVFVQILSASDPQFGLALAAALESFTFDPALRNGVPGFARVTYEHDFLKKDLSNSNVGDALDREETRPGSIHSSDELDQPLRPFSHSAPIFPTAWRGRVSTGTATVEFLVSKDGHVCLPRIVSASAPEFGYAAVQAVSEWLYDPPLVGGSPAVVRMRLPINFKFTQPVP